MAIAPWISKWLYLAAPGWVGHFFCCTWLAFFTLVFVPDCTWLVLGLRLSDLFQITIEWFERSNLKVGWDCDGPLNACLLRDNRKRTIIFLSHHAKFVCPFFLYRLMSSQQHHSAPHIREEVCTPLYIVITWTKQRRCSCHHELKFDKFIK